MKKINIVKMCRSLHPQHYKKGALDFKVDYEFQRSLKSYLFAEKPMAVGSAFRSGFDFINIQKDPAYPDKEKPETSAPNKRYILSKKAVSKKFKKFACTQSEFDRRFKEFKVDAFEDNKLATGIFEAGEVMKQYNVFYSVVTKKFQANRPKKLLKNFVECSFEVDFLFLNGKSGFAVVTVFEKSIDPNSLVWTLASEGLDIYSSFLKDALETIEKLDDLEVYIFAIETANSKSTMFLNWSDLSVDVGRESYEKRIATMKFAKEKAGWDSYDFKTIKKRDGKDDGDVLKIGLASSSIIKRESNEYW
jgi:hypothetical protein